MNSLKSYDDLLAHVESLKIENSALRLELQDNSSHLTKLETEACTMKDVLSHLNSAMDEETHVQLDHNCNGEC